MTMITRWDPFREFVTLQDRMNRSVPRHARTGRSADHDDVRAAG